MYVFGVWEETLTPGENPHVQRENWQTQHRKAQAGGNSATFSLWGICLTTVAHAIPTLGSEWQLIYIHSNVSKVTNMPLDSWQNLLQMIQIVICFMSPVVSEVWAAKWALNMC